MRIVLRRNGDDQLGFNADENSFVMPENDVVVVATFQKAAYSIFYPETDFGGFDAPAEAHKGDTVIISAYFNEGYELENLVILYMEKEQIAYDTISENTFRFIMPDGEVVVTATFTKTTDVQEVSTSNLYTANGRIYYNGDLRIFDLLGRDVTADNGSLKGVYVVRTQEGVKRVVVK